MEKQAFDLGFRVSLGDKRIVVSFDFGVGKFLDFVIKVDEPTQNIKKAVSDAYKGLLRSLNADGTKEVK